MTIKVWTQVPISPTREQPGEAPLPAVFVIHDTFIIGPGYAAAQSGFASAGAESVWGDTRQLGPADGSGRNDFGFRPGENQAVVIAACDIAAAGTRMRLRPGRSLCIVPSWWPRDPGAVGEVLDHHLGRRRALISLSGDGSLPSLAGHG